jgi:hypothetical protein
LWRGVFREPGCRAKEPLMLALEMVVLALATFAAMLGFVALCDRV